MSRPHRSADRVAHHELSVRGSSTSVHLGRRQPGHLRRVSLDVEAPDDLGTEIITATPGSNVHLDLRLETVAEGIVATGTVSAGFAGECVRCLAPVAFTETADFQELYVYTRRVKPRTTRPSGCRVTTSTSSLRCGTRWCWTCRSSRCAGRTARGCAWSAGSRSPRIPGTITTTGSTHGGPPCRASPDDRCSPARVSGGPHPDQRPPSTRAGPSADTKTDPSRTEKERPWPFRSARCRAATPVTAVPSGRPPRRRWSPA